MQESFLIKGYKNAHIVENDYSQVTELMIITREVDYFPSDELIDAFMNGNNLDRCEVVKSYRRSLL